MADSSSDEILWHYCTAEAFLSIINNRTLRFSSISHSNDSNEHIYGKALLDEVLEEYDYDNNFEAFLDFHLLTFIDSSAFLGCCFSTKKDLLSQWRGYAQNGEGFSIGFSRKYLESSLTGFPSERVVYKTKDQKKFLKELINDLLIYFTETGEYGPLRTPDLVSQLGILLACFKSNAFKEEAEHRILMELKRFHIPFQSRKLIIKQKQYDSELDKNVQFRLVRNIPVPYYDRKFQTDPKIFPIKKIIIGPRNSSTVADIDTLLGCKGIHDVEVLSSKASYR